MSLAGRPSVRVHDHVHGIVLVDNPDFPKQHGRLQPCHDGTPMLDFLCPHCGRMNHAHESQIAGVPRDAEVALRCHSCRTPIITTVTLLERGFAESRKAMEPTS